MASYQSKKSDDRKASSLAEPAVTQASVRHRREENDRPGRGAGMMPGASARRRRVIAILVDILLLLLLAGLIAGGWFAYRAIREVYAPTWETREVVFRVEMTGIDPDMVKYGQDGRLRRSRVARWPIGDGYRRAHRSYHGARWKKHPDALPHRQGSSVLP